MNFTRTLADGIARAKGRIEDALGENLTQAVDEAERVMKDRVPVRTGELRNSITREKDGTTQRIRVSAPHAMAIEFGTKSSPPQPYWRPGVQVMRKGAKARRVRSR